MELEIKNGYEINKGMKIMDTKIQERVEAINSTNKTTNEISKKTMAIVDGLCGAGKTYALGQHIKRNEIVESNNLIITPTKILANQIYRDCVDTHHLRNIQVIHSDNTNTVGTEITNEMRTNHSGNTIVATQKSLDQIHLSHVKADWNLFVDEIPSIDKCYEINLPHKETHKLLFDLIQIKESTTPDLFEVELSDNSAAVQFVNRNSDHYYDHIKPIIKDLLNGNKMFLDNRGYNKIFVKNDITDDSEVDMTYGNTANRFYFLSMTMPNIYDDFHTVTMMGANFTQSMLYYWWSNYCDVEFNTHEEISKKLRYSSYQNGSRVVIKYFSEKNYSKYLRNTKIKNSDKTVGQHFYELVEKEFDDAPYLTAVNNDEQEVLKGTEIPVICHGINKFDHYNNIVFGAALNRTPKHIKMLQSLGFDMEFVNRANAYEICHQAIMRTSLRRPDCDDTVTIIVSDKSMAESLARLFVGCKIGQLGEMTETLKKVKAITPNDINKKKKAEKLKSLYEINSNEINGVPKIEEIVYNTKSSIFGSDEIEIEMSQYSRTKHSFNPNEFKGTAMGLVGTLQQIFNNNVIDNKEDTWLFNGTIFGEDNGRKKANALYSTFVTLDIDSGDLEAEEFHRIFTEDHPYSHIMMNSASRKESDKNRYRAIFFINQKVDNDVYEDIHKHICGIISKYGYVTCTAHKKAEIIAKKPDTKFSGIDWSKQQTSNIFYAPCQIKGREEYAFFWKAFTRNAAELKRYAIDPVKVVRYSQDKIELDRLVYETEEKEIKGGLTLSDIKDKLMSGSHYFGTHVEYMTLVKNMRLAGFDLNDVIDVTPHVSNSKTSKDAREFWDRTKTYTQGSIGALVNQLKHS